jgi:hypothetical protein
MPAGVYDVPGYGVDRYDAGAAPDLAAARDPDFLSGMVHSVALWRDANRSGADATDRGARLKDYRPVAGVGVLRCRVNIKEGRPRDVDHKPGVVAWGTVRFPDPVTLDLTHALVWLNPPDGAARNLYVEGRSVDHYGTFLDESAYHHTTVRVVEYVA